MSENDICVKYLDFLEYLLRFNDGIGAVQKLFDLKPYLRKNIQETTDKAFIQKL